jgi:hypothetical protein
MPTCKALAWFLALVFIVFRFIIIEYSSSLRGFGP